MSRVETLTGWGRWPKRACHLVRPATPEAAAGMLGSGSAIPRGLGRGYGDCALNPETTIASDRLDRMCRFDPDTGVLEAEAGVSLAEIIETFLPRGFFLPVTPGTRFVTLGGAIAADVHGKNHHVAGSFGDHVLWFDLLTSDGRIRRCSPQKNVRLFKASFGGMGLTGMVLRCALRLMPVQTGWIRQRQIVADNLEAAIEAFETHLDATYSVAWIDCMAKGRALGRSLITLGEHASVSDPDLPPGDPLCPPAPHPRRVPVDPPAWALNRLTLQAFNAAYFRAGQRAPITELVSWQRYFYPLDAVLDWNRIYGARGFSQYQCVVPLAGSKEALSAMLETISDAGLGSFLAVLKRFGPGALDRPLSFPMEGYTLALDFPLTGAALTLMDRLDEITCAHGGRLYLAKDARMTQQSFEQGYGAALKAFAAQKDPRFSSLQSQRLGL